MPGTQWVPAIFLAGEQLGALGSTLEGQCPRWFLRASALDSPWQREHSMGSRCVVGQLGAHLLLLRWKQGCTQHPAGPWRSSSVRMGGVCLGRVNPPGLHSAKLTASRQKAAFKGLGCVCQPGHGCLWESPHRTTASPCL